MFEFRNKNAVCGKYNCQTGIQIQIYSGWHSLANTNTNIFELTYFSKNKYKYIQIPFTWWTQIQIYFGCQKYKYKHKYLDLYLLIKRWKQIFITHLT